MSALLHVVERSQDNVMLVEDYLARESGGDEPARGRCAARRGRRALERACVELTVRTERQSQLVDITRARARTAVAGAEGAAVLVYVPHTTAGVTINEHADPLVARDFETALERIVPADWAWQHVEEGEENAPTHIRAAFMGPSVRVPLRDDGVARARHLAGHLLLRVRRAARALGARHRAAVAPAVRGRVAATPRAPCLMAAPVRNGEELELRVDSLAYGGNGVARLDGFVVFVRRGLPGRHRARSRDEGEARLRRGDRRRGARRRARPRRGAVPALRRLRRLPLPGLRVRAASSRRRSRRCATRSSGSAGSPTRRSSRSSPPRSQLPLPQQARVLVHRRPTDGPALGFHRAGRWDEVLDDRGVPAHDRPRQRDPRRGAGVGARGGARGLRPGHADRLSPAPRRARGPQHGPGARHARHRTGRAASTPTT